MEKKHEMWCGYKRTQYNYVKEEGTKIVDKINRFYFLKLKKIPERSF